MVLDVNLVMEIKRVCGTIQYDHITHGNMTSTNMYSVDAIVYDSGKRACHDYVRGQCMRGADCKYAHTLPQVAQICEDYQIGKCTRGAECKYAHSTGPTCKDYQRGMCTRGEKCKYYHDKNMILKQSTSNDNNNNIDTTTLIKPTTPAINKIASTIVTENGWNIFTIYNTTVPFNPTQPQLQVHTHNNSINQPYAYQPPQPQYSNNVSSMSASTQPLYASTNQSPNLVQAYKRQQL